MLYPLWQATIPGDNTEIPSLCYYTPTPPASRCAILVLAGGAYRIRAPHEGAGYAEFLAKCGIHAFVLNYRAAPAHFPSALLDARRGVRYLRAEAERFGISPDKILVMGSSAGGHLAAHAATYRGSLAGEPADAVGEYDPTPSGQILCYPVISSDEEISHRGSYEYLLGERYAERASVDPERLVSRDTPPAFIWHTSTDSGVNVINSYRYATALHKAGVDAEVHVFPIGEHGLGLAKDTPHVAQWAELLCRWLRERGFLS